VQKNLQEQIKMPELWDVYDANRQRTGKIIERPSAWGQEAYHLIIHVAIFDCSHRMLIQHRCHEKHAWADLWDISAGGSALAGEESWQAAERETREELGIRLDLEHVRPHFSINYTRGFDDFYTVEIPDLDLATLKLQTGEVDQARWATLNEVRQMLKDGSFVPYFPGLIELLWEVKDNYDGAIQQKK
jgi:isopentenyldiphosphate isomerase